MTYGFIHHLSLSLVTLHNGGVVCVIHDNPNFHTGEWQPHSPCQHIKQKTHNRSVQSVGKAGPFGVLALLKVVKHKFGSSSTFKKLNKITHLCLTHIVQALFKPDCAAEFSLNYC